MSDATTAPPSFSIRRIATVAGVAMLCAGLAVAAIGNISVFNRINQFLQDWGIASDFAPMETQDPRIVIVAIDESTLQQLPYRSPVDRQFVSDLVRKLEAHGPAAIGIDLELDQATEPAKDENLRQTLMHPDVPLRVSVADADYTGAIDDVAAARKQFQNAMVPLPERGLANLATDQFDTARFVFPGATVDGHYIPGIVRALAGAVGVHTPAVQVPIIWRGRPPATATDPDPRPFLEIPALAAGLMPDAWFRNKIVLIGSDLTLVDRHRTPFSATREGDAGQLPGVVIQAHALSQFLHAKISPIVDWPVDLAAALVLALLGAALGIGDARMLWRLPGAVALIGLFWAGAIALFHFHDVMLGLLAPPLALIASFAILDSLGGRAARKQREFIQGAFGRYVSPKLVERMVQDPTRMSLEGERRLMTFLFSDIQDFTTMSEKLDSKDLAPLLNAYLDGMTAIVMKHDGMVDKFIGDAVFAIFNAPLDLADHAQKAVRCMLELDRFAERFRREQNGHGIPLGVTRIGVHTGMAVIGNFGSQARFTYTAQGDAVNTASRLEGINKYFGTRLCVSDATRILCPDIAFRPVALAVLKGKTEAMELWEPLQEGAHPPGFLDAYRTAYDRLKMEQEGAGTLFDALLAAMPDDPCVKLHVRRLGQGASGVKIVMTEK